MIDAETQKSLGKALRRLYEQQPGQELPESWRDLVRTIETLRTGRPLEAGRPAAAASGQRAYGGR